VLLVNKNGEKLSEIAPTKEALKSAMVNVGPVAVEAGIATGLVKGIGKSYSMESIHKPNKIQQHPGSAEEIVEDVVETSIKEPKSNLSFNKNISFEHLENDKIISESEEPATEVGTDVGVSPPIKSLTFSTNANARRPSANRVITQTVPNNAIRHNKMNNTEGLSKSDAEEITSLRAEPVSPGIGSDTRPIKAVVGGSYGSRQGGSLYGIMSQSAYRLAPAAVLLATAAAVMKKKTRTKHRMQKRRHTKRR